MGRTTAKTVRAIDSLVELMCYESCYYRAHQVESAKWCVRVCVRIYGIYQEIV